MIDLIFSSFELGAHSGQLLGGRRGGRRDLGALRGQRHDERGAHQRRQPSGERSVVLDDGIIT